MVGYRISNRFRAPRQKVFGIGLSRTGTKSLDRALSVLGYRSDHFSTHLLRLEDGVLSLDMRKAAVYEALTDITASLFFRELDEAFPGSKFVLTVRDSDGWLRSCCDHFLPLEPGVWPYGDTKVLELLRRVYASNCFDSDRFLAAYHAHAEAVRRYFASRPDSLLVFNVCAGDDWGLLCTFLGKPEPKVPFPWVLRRSAPILDGFLAGRFSS
jgi:Sulfotransferase domain